MQYTTFMSFSDMKIAITLSLWKKTSWQRRNQDPKNGVGYLYMFKIFAQSQLFFSAKFY